jgi:hypothetical protein
MTAHTCVADLNEKLAEHNTRLADTISFSSEPRELIQLTTVKADEKKRGRPVLMYASYCPFCGVKLNNGSAA